MNFASDIKRWPWLWITAPGRAQREAAARHEAMVLKVMEHIRSHPGLQVRHPECRDDCTADCGHCKGSWQPDTLWAEARERLG